MVEQFENYRCLIEWLCNVHFCNQNVCNLLSISNALRVTEIVRIEKFTLFPIWKKKSINRYNRKIFETKIEFMLVVYGIDMRYFIYYVSGCIINKQWNKYIFQAVELMCAYHFAITFLYAYVYIFGSEAMRNTTLMMNMDFTYRISKGKICRLFQKDLWI